MHRGRVRPSDAADAKVAMAMTDAWVCFAKTGDPNGGDLHLPTTARTSRTWPSGHPSVPEMEIARLSWT
jgi:carboxylesterase type B